tara:strand:- start:9319 stop:9939 length:621 start_codon:yes stop_codon:yes gene_type:complete
MDCERHPFLKNERVLGLRKPTAVDRQEVFERLLRRNVIRLALGLPALNIPHLYRCKVGKVDLSARHPQSHRGKLFLTKKTILTQADLDPSEEQRQKIKADIMTRNAVRRADGLPERDVMAYAELRYDGHRARAYQDLLSPYLNITLAEIQPADGSGASPEDYRNAVAKAQEQLRDATGIVPPVSTAKAGIAKLRDHGQSFLNRSVE